MTMRKESRYNDRKRYFDELATSSRKYFISYVKGFKGIRGSAILEIGCGEGGNLLPFAEEGCEVTGVDIAPKKIENATAFFAETGHSGSFTCCDFLSFPDDKKYDVIIMHDVIEHIEPEYKASFLGKALSLLKDDGIIFCAFPSWQMPFGGHQQICKSRICSKIPFVHLLPTGLYRRYLNLFNESKPIVDDLMSIKRSQMRIRKFERLCDETGAKRLDRTLWLINPHYEIKFGLKPARLVCPFDRIPGLRCYLATSCFYILGKQN